MSIPTKMSVNDAAVALGVSPATLRQMSNDGRVPCTRLTNGYRIFDARVIEAARAKREQKRVSRLQ
jgi:predicted site-specific integrase-resolvase